MAEEIRNFHTKHLEYIRKKEVILDPYFGVGVIYHYQNIFMILLFYWHMDVKVEVDFDSLREMWKLTENIEIIEWRVQIPHWLIE